MWEEGSVIFHDCMKPRYPELSDDVVYVALKSLFPLRYLFLGGSDCLWVKWAQ